MFPRACRKLTVLFPELSLVDGKVRSARGEEESSALLPAKGRQIKAVWGTRQPQGDRGMRSRDGRNKTSLIPSVWASVSPSPIPLGDGETQSLDSPPYKSMNCKGAAGGNWWQRRGHDLLCQEDLIRLGSESSLWAWLLQYHGGFQSRGLAS